MLLTAPVFTKDQLIDYLTVLAFYLKIVTKYDYISMLHVGTYKNELMHSTIRRISCGDNSTQRIIQTIKAIVLKDILDYSNNYNEAFRREPTKYANVLKGKVQLSTKRMIELRRIAHTIMYFISGASNNPIKVKYWYSGHKKVNKNFSVITDFCKQHGMYDWKIVAKKQVIKNYIPGLDVTAAEAKGIMGMNIVAAKQSQQTLRKQKLIEEEEYKDNQ
ncbi:Hypothetical_protein [Hexamita inflata]|uniref:Hypothetical_protein n=1 Tax=Hexamita inflata TaxID=28002 RepID=A0AA86PBN5_9EUKA|nr:Hypothetical protein HINF_LOCUS20829 [Hexamita inflata]